VGEERGDLVTRSHPMSSSGAMATARSRAARGAAAARGAGWRDWAD
jgi:hypothetical protein